MSLTRRALLERLGLAGGVSAVYLGMEAMGLLNAPPAAAEPFALPPAPGRKRSVVVLGAGIAGLVAAYELRRSGWDVTVLEARDRIGLDQVVSRLRELEASSGPQWAPAPLLERLAAEGRSFADLRAG